MEKLTEQTQTPDPAAELAALKTKLADTERERDTFKTAASEKEAAANFWYQKANAGGKPEEKKPETEEEDEDILEILGKGGTKGFKAWIAKQGLMTRADAEKLIQNKSVQLIRENQMVERYPELKDKNSDFFKATSTEFVKLKKQGVDEGIAMELAAERVELEQLRGGKRKLKSQEEEEEDRLERVRAQSGDRTRRPSDRSQSDALTSEEKSMIKRFGLKEEDYKASRKSLVIAGGR